MAKLKIEYEPNFGLHNDDTQQFLVMPEHLKLKFDEFEFTHPYFIDITIFAECKYRSITNIQYVDVVINARIEKNNFLSDDDEVEDYDHKYTVYCQITFSNYDYVMIKVGDLVEDDEINLGLIAYGEPTTMSLDEYNTLGCLLDVVKQWRDDMRERLVKRKELKNG